MNRIAPLLALLTLVSSAQAGLQLSVDSPPTSALEPGQTLSFDIVGQDPVPDLDAPWIFIQGPGHIDGATLLYPGSLSDYQDDDEVVIALAPATRDQIIQDLTAATGYEDLRDFAFITLADGSATPAPLTGTLVSGITFTCDGPGDATLILLDGNFATLDTMVVSQIPEPATALLLALGSLALARRRS